MLYPDTNGWMSLRKLLNLFPVFPLFLKHDCDNYPKGRGSYLVGIDSNLDTDKEQAMLTLGKL